MFFIDLFWQRRDFTGQLTELPLIHRAVQRFKATTRLSQAMANVWSAAIRIMPTSTPSRT